MTSLRTSRNPGRVPTTVYLPGFSSISRLENVPNVPTRWICTSVALSETSSSLTGTSKVGASFEPVDVHHENNRAANLDFDVFGEVEQAWLEGRGIGNGNLGAAPAGPFEDAHDRVDVLVLDADQETGIAGAQE